MTKLKIYKASAGSGKTYTLAKEFLMLLFDKNNIFNYRYILAVTFTNKATAEMKTRIITYLYALTVDEAPEFLGELMRYTNSNEEQVRKRAKEILTFILNDFSHFNITTIDSFFQKIIRSFAFEAGLPTNFRIELDTDVVLNEAIDSIFKELDVSGNEEVKAWILNQTFSKLQDKGDWKITREMILLGKEIFKEEFQRMSNDMTDNISDKKFLNNYRNALKNIIDDFENGIKQRSQKALDRLAGSGLTIDDLKSKQRSPLNWLNRILVTKKPGDDIPKGLERIETVTDADALYTKTAKRKNDIFSCYNSGLKDALDELKRFYHAGKDDYFTAMVVLPNISSLGVIVDIAKKIKDLSLEKNYFLLSDANQLLNRIIDDNDAPFIYEKTGTRYRHYMIDEFQDTSDMQWSNFRPLVLNSLSEGNRALVVGDVKQSIYRWRNSDWQLLGKHILKEFPQYGVEVETLQTNWRSFERVIGFNNFIFGKSAETLQTAFQANVTKENPDIELDPELATLITGAYSDVSQVVSKSGVGKGGYVELKFITCENADEYEEIALPLLREKIDMLTDAGYEYSDICILVRKTDEGKMISEYLLGNQEKRYPVISDETLVLESSPAVLLVVAKLEFINNPENEILRSHIRLYEKILREKGEYSVESLDAGMLNEEPGKDIEELLNSLPELKGKPLFELTETLVRQLPEWIKDDQQPYLKELLNRVQEFINSESVNLADFIEWWDDKGHTSAIAIPEGQNAIKIMTVHKSKGLEFKVVIVPFCHWQLDRKSHDSLIWCKPDSAPFNKLELVPVAYTNRLIKTRFYSQFINERLLQYVDNLNILYVAFTRAREALVAIGMKKVYQKEPDKLETISDLLIKTIEENAGSLSDELKDNGLEWDEDALHFRFGTVPVKSGSKQVQEAVPAEPFKTIPLGSRIKIHTDSNAMQPELLEDYRVHGKIMHLLFEKIKTVDDIGSAIDALIFEGKLLSEDKGKLQAKIEELLSGSPFNDWFSGKYKVLNEASILQRSGTVRPDRVLIGYDKVIVIDYKFGQKKSNKYIRQVKHYMELIRSMDEGYKNVEGYLWYVSKGSELEKVE